ncbi:MAG: hypothetical protein QM796_00730 [Chthoniobacteraceae bacterium]
MRNPFHRFRTAAFTLVELMVTTGMVSVAGLVIFLIFNNGMILFAKNSAINLAHQDYRQAVQLFQNDLHKAVSVPFYLSSSASASTTLPSITVDSVTYNGANVTTTAQGISFQTFGGTSGEGFEIGRNIASGSNQVVITGSNATPVAGQRLIIPAYQIEADISAVSSSGSGTTALYTLTLASILSSSSTTGTSTISGDITACSASNYTTTVYGSGITDYHIICYLTNRVVYLATPISGTSPQAYQLRYYPCYNATYNTSYTVFTFNLFTSTPFQIATINTSTNQQYTAVSMSLQDRLTNNRGYKVTNTYFTTNVPYRYSLTTYQ